jgi:uroporphyrinogen decarboxylase
MCAGPGLLPRVIGDAPLSAIFFWEDMCYRGGPLISPAMFREFMLPRYKRITELARSLGIDVIFVDSDGDVSELIPLWLESGISRTNQGSFQRMDWANGPLTRPSLVVTHT